MFALLYTETGAFNVRVAGTREPQESAALLVLAGIVVFGGFLISMILPFGPTSSQRGSSPMRVRC